MAKVRKMGKGKPEILNRPLQKLFPLEITCSTPCEEGRKGKKSKKERVDVTTENNVNESRVRHCRAVAKDARWKSQLMLGP